MTARLVLASRNAGKLAELRRILAGLDVALVGLDGLPDVPEVAETGTTFADNALHKARTVAAAVGMPAVADDSGIAVAALHGMPGILSARWCGRHGDDAANLALLLAQISELLDERRDAAFVCAAAVALPDGQARVVEAKLEGSLVREPRGSHGFGYDPIFRPWGERRTTAELSASEKDAMSHRGQAFRALLPALKELGLIGPGAGGPGG
ncbi:MAG TPA: RdgB/HAM1 family non-canonical purine NTP pyrophosphatase [Mycobacteriales bacterium]|nr:RdgB/HAM1 family non-canonical purine NTP pyrophosphatase [Mycobacteriales bacterium]